MVFALIQGCGGGGGGGGGAAAPAAVTPNANVAAGPNVQPISVNSGLAGSVNLAFTSVTLCEPGNPSNCQTIDNILVDTGATGLRIMSSALSASLVLPQQSDAAGDAVLECGHFANGYTWGPVKIADFKISGEQASGLPIQVIGDPQFPQVPGACSATGASLNSVSQLNANGILGLAIFRQDCGHACALSSSPGFYYTCGAAGCQPAVMPLAMQLQQPVSMFSVNNNGVIVQLPSVPAGGASGAEGALLFGIGTQANNGIGTATVIGVDSFTANFTTVYNGVSLNASFLDSGSNAYFFADPGTPVCTNSSTSGFYCPPATKNLSAIIQGRNGRSATIAFSLANAAALLAGNPGYTAFVNLGAPELSATSFDWGLPFFYGRKVYTAIEGASTPAGPGPYVAF